ncbi:MAG: hypothetical protein BMS9Abin20_0369 [Acidimicrobiia bacterium]|nr:MAG: hypothetical protein BMS9Abin20_0369 [Acidimicrobiia bacterium]
MLHRVQLHARVGALVVAGVLFLAACVGGYGGYGQGPEKPDGEGTSSGYGIGAFSQPASNLSADEIAIFRIGNVFVTETWSAAPGSVPERDGLGPTYLASSCAGCHVADGLASASEWRTPPL